MSSAWRFVGGRREMMRAVATVLAVLWCARTAHADRYEATVVVRPLAALARLAESGVEDPAQVAGGGLVAGIAWGSRNWLDLGVELAATAMAEARHPDAMVRVSGNFQTGELRRTTRLAQLRAGATLRLGVGWVPTVHVGIGAGGRMRSAATLRVESGGGVDLAPDDAAAEVTLDVVALLRVGLDHRITRRWTFGVAAGVSQCFGLGAPDVQMLDAAVTFAYSWYPLW